MASIQEDNIYRKVVPSRAPQEQEEDENKEKMAVINQFSVIVEVIDRLKADIAFYESNDGISDEVLLNPEEFMHTVAGNKKAVASIRRELQILEDLVEKHSR